MSSEVGLTRRYWGTAAIAVGALLLGCDDESLNPPDPIDPLFERYAAIGNSITAGFQSGGINDSTQLESYVVLLAENMGLEVGAEFFVPLLAPPGCPPPLVNVFTGDRIADGAEDDCALRANVPPTIHNVAVPGAATADVLDVLGPNSDPNPLTTLLLGGRTQLEALAEAEPTFVTVWIGNNDVLSAALNGDTTRATPPDRFESDYEQLTSALDGLNLRGAALIGVADVTLIPHLSPGAAYFEAAQEPDAFPDAFSVNPNCAPASRGGVGESSLVPFEYGFGVLIARAEEGIPAELDCVGDAPVLTASEVATLRTRVSGFNAVIREEAEARGWAFLDPNPALQGLVDAGEIPAFPNIEGQDAIRRPFGEFFSRDGFHPSLAIHRLVVDRLSAEINDTFGTSLPIGLLSSRATGR